MKKLIPFLATILLLAASCKKDGPFGIDDKLPAATMSGKNTFGCKINGKVWLPAGGSLWDSPVQGKHDREWVGCDQLYVYAKRVFENDEVSIYQEMSLNVWCPKLGENEISFSKGRYTDFQGCGDYYLDTLNPHILFVTKLDTINFIASGTFEFTVINNDYGDTLRITEGRFDVDSHL